MIRTAQIAAIVAGILSGLGGNYSLFNFFNPQPPPPN